MQNDGLSTTVADELTVINLAQIPDSQVPTTNLDNGSLRYKVASLRGVIMEVYKA